MKLQTCFASGLLVVFLAGSMAFGGASGKGGGDVVFCTPSPLNSLGTPHGAYYALDYTQTLTPTSPPPPHTPSYQSSLVEIQNSWYRTQTFLLGLRNLSDFSDQIFSDKLTGARVWEPSSEALVSVHDEGLLNSLPVNCQRMGIIQAVIRQSVGKKIFYKYDANLLDQMLKDKDNQLQLSYLFFHEWLRDYVDDAELLRRLNRFFHSADFLKIDNIQFQELIWNMRINFDTTIEQGIFDRSQKPFKEEFNRIAYEFYSFLVEEQAFIKSAALQTSTVSDCKHVHQLGDEILDHIAKIRAKSSYYEIAASNIDPDFFMPDERWRLREMANHDIVDLTENLKTFNIKNRNCF